MLERHRLESLRKRCDQLVEIDCWRVQVDLAGFDLRQVEDVVDERQQVVAGGGDAARELDLLGRQIAVAIVGQQLGEDQRAVERRAQLVRHVGEELSLVAVGARELGALRSRSSLAPTSSSCCWPELLRVLLELHVGLLELGLLGLEPRLRVAQLRALRLQLLVGDAQLFLLRLQLFGLALGLLQQVLALAAQRAGADGDGDGFADRGQQFEIGSVGRLQEAQFDDALHGVPDRERRDQQRMRLAPAQARAYAQVVRRAGLRCAAAFAR